MYGLILDTATPTSYLLLTREGKPISSFQTTKSKKISNDLFETLQDWVVQFSLRDTLQYLAMGTGPGSFTGTRIGITLAKSLAYAFKLPLLSFHSLVGYSPEKEGPFTILFDAKSLGFHLLSGKKTEGKLFFEPPTFPLSQEKIEAHLENSSACIIHPLQALERLFPFFVHWEKREPNFSFLAAFIYQKFLESTPPFSPFSPVSSGLSCEKEQNLLPSSQIKASAFSEVKLESNLLFERI